MGQVKGALPGNILILGFEGDGLRGLDDALRRAIGPHAVIHRVGSAGELQASLAGLPYDIAVVEFPAADQGRRGAEIVSKIRATHPELPVIAVSPTGDVASANRAVGSGATDYLVMGERLQERVETLLTKLQGLLRVIEHKQVLEVEHRRLFDAERERYRILGDSPQIKRIITQVRRIATVPRPVLIVGERGTGKELVARAIHTAAGPATRPFVAVNCAAFPDALLESELFGHERGAFTGADRRTPGRFEQASGGTLFLDEIGFMSLAFQKKILRTVEYGSFTRVGGSVEVRTSTRIIAATNVDLAERMKRGEFLRDLYDRLAFEVISVPPLREREGDIELLAQEFLLRFMREIPAFQGKALSQRAIAALRRYPFPGNVRELKNIIERAAYKDTTNEITPEDIDLPHAQSSDRRGGFAAQVEALKRSLILRALEDSAGNQAAAARRLGLTYHQFRHYHRKYSGTKPAATAS